MCLDSARYIYEDVSLDFSAELVTVDGGTVGGGLGEAAMEELSMDT